MNWEEAVCSLRDDPSMKEVVMACYYDDPLIEAAERFWKSNEWLALKDELPIPPSKVLELGAGRGIASYAFAKEGWDVTALEPDASEIVGTGAIRRLFRESKLTINVVEEWGEFLPFEDETFDLVYGRAVFHHADNLEKFCSEACRVLKPQGIFIMTREHVLSSKDEEESFLKSHPLHHLYGGEAAYMLDEYLDAMRCAGMKIRTVKGPSSSAVNYFPQSDSEMRRDIVVMMQRRFWPIGGLITRVLFNFKSGLDYLQAYSDSVNDEPGRLYLLAGEKV